MRLAACLGLALLLAGCASEDSGAPLIPAENVLEDGDCHTMAMEHEAEATWQNVDSESLQRVFKAAYDDCQQWRSGHVWNSVGQ